MVLSLRQPLLLLALCCVHSATAWVQNAGLTRLSSISSTRSSSRSALQQQPKTVLRAEEESDDAYERVKQSLWDSDSSLAHIFENNRKWAQDVIEKDPEAFERVKYAQSPKYLYIGCSDSRVPAERMFGMNLGELFVHRNVANLCVPSDYSMLAVLQYSVEVLQVTDIIVCGHYGCGGVKAAMTNKDHGLLEHWLYSIRGVQRLHQEELTGIADDQARHDRLVELNVQEACMNLFANPIVQKKQTTDSQPRIHGLVYDIGSGTLKDIKIDFDSEIRKYKDIYRLYDFPINPGMTSKKSYAPWAPDAPGSSGVNGSGKSGVNETVGSSNDDDDDDDDEPRRKRKGLLGKIKSVLS